MARTVGDPRNDRCGDSPGRLDDECKVHHIAFMAKEAAVTVRIPISLKRRLEAMATREHRSLSAQIAAVLERDAPIEPVETVASGKLLGRYEGTPTPSDAELEEVRRHLWGTLGSRDPHAS